jgi:hypothetical protein
MEKHEGLQNYIRWLGTYWKQNPKFRNFDFERGSIEELAKVAGIPAEELECRCRECMDQTIKPC